MEFVITEYKRCFVIKADGRIDSTSAQEVEKRLMELTNSEKSIIIDMQAVNSFPVQGGGRLFAFRKNLRTSIKPTLSW